MTNKFKKKCIRKKTNSDYSESKIIILYILLDISELYCPVLMSPNEGS